MLRDWFYLWVSWWLGYLFILSSLIISDGVKDRGCESWHCSKNLTYVRVSYNFLTTSLSSAAALILSLQLFAVDISFPVLFAFCPWENCVCKPAYGSLSCPNPCLSAVVCLTHFLDVCVGSGKQVGQLNVRLFSVDLQTGFTQNNMGRS